MLISLFDTEFICREKMSMDNGNQKLGYARLVWLGPSFGTTFVFLS